MPDLNRQPAMTSKLPRLRLTPPTIGLIASVPIALALCALVLLYTSLPLAGESNDPSLSDLEPTAHGHGATNRLIVEFQSPGVAQVFGREGVTRNGSVSTAGLDDAVEIYTFQLQNEQLAFQQNLTELETEFSASSVTGLDGSTLPLAFKAVTNAIVLEATAGFSPAASQAIAALPNVRAVHRDLEVHSQLYIGPQLVRAWTNTPLNNTLGFDGSGILVGSIDAGLHHAAPMFSGANFKYPTWFPQAGLGIAENNNGKIIASRTYFRSGDPPRSDDYHAWPGNGSSHGVHTGAIAAGNIVSDAAFRSISLPTLSGIAPRAWLGSYRVFYKSRSGKSTFFSAEGIAALEDTVKDGMDVVIGSWGTGPSVNSPPYNILDSALTNAAATDMVVVMAAGNYGPMPFSVANPSDQYLTVGAVSTGGRFNIAVSGNPPAGPTRSGLDDRPGIRSSDIRSPVQTWAETFLQVGGWPCQGACQHAGMQSMVSFIVDRSSRVG